MKSGVKKATAAEIAIILLKHEKPLRNEEYEHCFAVNDAGEIIFRRKGAKDYIIVEDALPLLRKARVFTHNHPSGSAFSDDDLIMAITSEVQELRCFGNEYWYSLRPKKGKWEVKPSVAAQDWREIKNQLRSKYQSLFEIQVEKIGKERAQREVWLKHSHEILLTLAKRHNLIYKRSKW